MYYWSIGFCIKNVQKDTAQIVNGIKKTLHNNYCIIYFINNIDNYI